MYIRSCSCILEVIFSTMVILLRRLHDGTLLYIHVCVCVSIVTDGEDQPLLSNPDVISLTAVHDNSATKEFLHHISPIDQDGWSELSLFKKFYEIFKVCMKLISQCKII